MNAFSNRPFRHLRLLIWALVFTVPGQTALSQKHTEVDERLRTAVEPLIKQHAGDVALAIRNLESGENYEFQADTPMPTASLIKLPMLVAAYRLADAGKLDLAKPVRLREANKVPGSGVLTEHFSNDVSLPLVDYLRLMIRYSDNTATNIVADQIGVKTTATTMEALGLPHTKLHSKVYRGDTTVFPERSQQFGLGSTTANEMVELLSLFESGKLVSKASTTAMRQHLLACDDRSKIASLLPASGSGSVPYAFKTGAIANCRTDAGILYTTDGPVAVCFLSNKNEDQSWTDTNAANVLAGKIGQAIVDRFGRPDSDQQLREGAFGKLVEALQRTLNARLDPTPGLSIDGDFGPATRAAIERFQRQQKLNETGVVNVATWSALGTLIEQDDPVPAPAVVNAEVLSTVPQAAFADPPMVTCKAWAIADRATGEVVFSHKADTPLEAASTTKVMTAFLVTRYAAQHPEVLDERILFSKRADNTVGSTAGIRAGEQVTVRELLYGLMLPSGNDASVAFAEHFGSRLAGKTESHVPASEAQASYDHFIEAMNAATQQLDMRHTHYMNTHGLSHEKHVITAASLAKLGSVAMQNELFQAVVRTRQFGCVATSEQGYQRNVLWKNGNRLLEIEGYQGIKTGTTSAAGACLISCGERDGDKLIAVVLGSSSSAARYSDTRNLLRWAWQQRLATNGTRPMGMNTLSL